MLAFVWVLLSAALATVTPAGELSLVPLELPGGGSALPVARAFSHEDAAENLSGAALVDAGGRAFLVVATDEGTEFASVDLGVSPPRARAHDLLDLLEQAGDDSLGDAEEIDLEGAAYAGGRLYLAGSAALKRKKPNKGSRKKNRRRLRTVVPVSGGEPGGWAEHSNFLYVLDVDLADGELRFALRGREDLRAALGEDALLRPSLAVPSKENGLDVEAFAVRGEELLVGLRGPVLRGHAVVARFEEGLDARRLSFLSLEGWGLRAMEVMDHPTFGEGVFLIAGPTMDHPGPFHLYRWDGEHDSFMEPGEGLERLGRLSPPDPGWKAESLFRCGADLCVLFDGPPGGAPHRIR